jgi:hypothetical protein
MTEDEEGTFRDHIATVDEKGKRKWIFPKKPKGKFFNYRQLTSSFVCDSTYKSKW